MFRESSLRSAAKALSWRLLGTIATTTVVLLFTRRLDVSLAVGALEFVAKVGLFWVHERAWDRLHFGRRSIRPAVIWFTGLSGSGKSTVADGVTEALQAQGHPVERLDGDQIRRLLPQTGFTREERNAHIRRVGLLASRLEAHGVFVVASFVSPYEESRRFVRELCTQFVEIHVATPVEVCEARDVKGLYRKARAGEIQHFTGISDPYEPPTQPEVRIDTSSVSVEDAVAEVLQTLSRLGVGQKA